MSDRFAHIERILLVRTDRLGDVILTLPMLPVLRKRYPGAYIATLLSRYTGQIVEGNSYVDELIWYDDGKALLPFEQIRRILRQKAFDASIVVHPTLRLAWLMFRSGIPVRIGSGYRYYSFLFNRRVFEHRSDAKRHEVEYNLGLLKELDCTEPGTPEFFVDIPPGAKFRVQELLSSLGVSNAKEIVVIHPGTGGSAREWSVENFGRLATALLDGQDVQIVLTGVYGDEWKVAEIRRRTHDRAFSFVGKLTLKELAALLQSAALFVSNSTGPLHLAVAVGTPVIGIYSQLTAMSPARWGPYTDKKTVFVPDRPADCSECKGKSVEQCACMERITVGDVYEAACAFLRSRKINEKHTITHG